MTQPQEPGRERPLYRRRHRLTRATDYRRAYCHGSRRSRGPLTVYALPNGLPEHRLGLSVGRRVGGAVLRNRVKRLLREAFRLIRTDLGAPEGGAYDIVITVRPHRPLPLAEYRRILGELVARAHEDLSRAPTERADGPA